MVPFFKRIIVSILTWEAQLVLQRYKPHIIAITGSVGKTSTKDAIYTAIASSFYVRKSEKSFNSDLGVPLTILGCDNAWHDPLAWIRNIVKGAWLAWGHADYPQWLVLEVGADRPGDIRSIAAWLKPHIVVITAIPDMPVHVEYFDSVDAVAAEKRSLAESLGTEGAFVVNIDDERARAMREHVSGSVITYGFSTAADYAASHYDVVYRDNAPVGTSFRVDHDGSSVPIVIEGSLGRTHVYPLLAALAVSSVLKIDAVKAAQALAEHAAPPGRMRLVPGVASSTIIDDTYNSSPAATLSALDTLESLRATKKICMLGDMLELGKYSADAHRRVGERAARVADMFITVGIRARAAAEAARATGMPTGAIRSYEKGESEQAALDLLPHIESGDVVLVKGSQSIRMERAVKVLMAHPEAAADTLVRQDTEWLAKV